MKNIFWKRSALIAATAGLLGASACGDDEPVKEADACDLEANPHLDCDGDGMPNGFEAEHGYDPLHPDENGNGVLDGWEDPDNDGLPTWAEIALGLDHLEPKTQVEGGTENDILDGLRDHDKDGSVNMAEAWMGVANAARGTVTSLWNPASVDSEEKPFVCNPNDEVAGNELFTDQAFRFTQLNVTVPKTMGTLLTGIMGPDIQNYALNILAPIANFDFGHCVSYFELSAGSGVGPELLPYVTAAQQPDKDLRDAENADIDQQNADIIAAHVFTLEDMSTIEGAEGVLPPEPVRAVVVQTSENTAFFRTITPLSMIFPGTLPTKDSEGNQGRFLLDLTHITAAGTLTLGEDGVVSLEAFIDGVIPFESAKNTKIRLSEDAEEQTIDDLMIGGTPFFSLPGADEPLGYNLRASFRAATVPYDTAPEEETGGEGAPE